MNEQEIEQLKSQNEKMREALEWYASFRLGGSEAYDWDIGEHARNVLKGLNGEEQK